MSRFSDSDENCYSVTRQVFPGEIEACHANSSLIVHYQIQVDVCDQQFNPIASRAKQKQIDI